MGKRVKLTIDGKGTRVREGTNLIAAAESVGIHIPNLCHVEGLKGIGACRLCLVEIRGLKSPVTACTTRAKEGMVVYTQTEQVREIRKCVIDLILSMHPLDCMTCTKAGVCNLQRYAYEFGIQKSSFPGKRFDYPVDRTNPFIKRDPDYCVLCGRCVRVCKQQGTSVLDFYGRGMGTRVMTAADRPLQESACTFCGSCLDACPVNALVEADRWRKGREWQYASHPSICLSCGNACDTQVSVHEAKVVRVRAGEDGSKSDHYICAYGRFGYEYVHSEKRIKQPLIRMGGGLTATTWDEALQVMAETFLSPHDVGIVTTGNFLNEDVLTLMRFTDAAGIKTATSTVNIYADPSSLLADEVDLEEADVFVLVGLDISQWDRVLPALDAMIRRQVAGGKKLIVIHSRPTKISEAAQFQLMGEETAGLRNLATALVGRGLEAPQGIQLNPSTLGDDVLQAAKAYAEAKKPVILSSPLFFEAARNVASVKGEALAIPIEANAKGTLMMGLNGNGREHLPPDKVDKRILFVAGDVPMERPKKTGYLIVAASHRTPLAMSADLVLPVTTAFEAQGTILDYRGRLRTLKKVMKPFGRSRMLRQILEGASKAMSITMRAATSADVKAVLASKKGPGEPAAFVKREQLEFDPATLIPAVNHAMIQNSRLISLFDGTLTAEGGR